MDSKVARNQGREKSRVGMIEWKSENATAQESHNNQNKFVARLEAVFNKSRHEREPHNPRLDKERKRIIMGESGSDSEAVSLLASVDNR